MDFNVLCSHRFVVFIHVCFDCSAELVVKYYIYCYLYTLDWTLAHHRASHTFTVMCSQLTSW